MKTKDNWSLKDFVLIGSILILSVILLGININKPFIGQHDWNGNWYGSIARNHLRYSLLKTKFGSFPSNGPVDTNLKSIYFTHYPPLFPLILATGMKLFGEGENVLRSIILVFSLGTLFFIYTLARELFSQAVAFIASVFATIVPMFLYYGKMPVHEPVLLFFILSSIYFYVLWFKTEQKKHMILSILFLTPGLLISWPAYFLPPILLIHYLVFHPDRKQVKILVRLIILEILIFIFHLIHVWWITGSLFGGGLIEIFMSRIASKSTKELYNLNSLKFVQTEGQYLFIYFTRVLTLLSLAGLIICIKLSRQSYNKSVPASLVIILLIIGSAYAVFFQEAAFIHDYLIYYLLPFIVISSAVATVNFLSFFTNSRMRALFLLVIVISVAQERRAYTKALLESNNSEKGYKLGKFIKKYTSFRDLIFVGSAFYGSFFSDSISYYGDRTVNYGEDIDISNLKKYIWIIRPKAHDALNKSTKQILDEVYIRHENADFIWYDIRQKKS